MISWLSGFQTLSRGLMSFHNARMPCLLNLVEFIIPRYSFLELQVLFSLFCKALPLLSKRFVSFLGCNLRLRTHFRYAFWIFLQGVAGAIGLSNFLAFSEKFFVLCVVRIAKVKFPSVFERYRALIFRSPVLASLSSELLFPCGTKLRATNYQVWQVLEFLRAAPRAIYFPWKVVLSTE